MKKEKITSTLYLNKKLKKWAQKKCLQMDCSFSKYVDELITKDKENEIISNTGINRGK